MSDVLYILGRGSKHDDMELRLYLRCLEKNAHGIGRVFFEVHCPINFNKHKFLLLSEIAERFKKEPTGILCRSLYWNIFNNWYFESNIVQDTKLRTDEWKDPNKTGCISTSDECDNILKVIEGMYPNKSRWEK